MYKEDYYTHHSKARDNENISTAAKSFPLLSNLPQPVDKKNAKKSFLFEF